MLVPPIPDRTAVVLDYKNLLMRREWIQWFRSLIDAVNVAGVVANVNLVTQSAAIPYTSIPIPQNMPSGQYRVSWYLRVTKAATTSSQLDINFKWNDTGVDCTYSDPQVVDANTTDALAQGSLVIDYKTGTPIYYSIDYVSVGADPMEYKVIIELEPLK